MTVNTRRFFYHYTRRFFSFKITLAVFFFRITRDVFFRDDAIITRDVFSMQYYTRRFFNAIITRDVFSKNYTRRFLELRFKLRVSLRTKMGAIIRLVCFIKTKNHVNTVHMARNQICISR
jgi:hypothetical protein